MRPEIFTITYSNGYYIDFRLVRVPHIFKFFQSYATKINVGSVTIYKYEVLPLRTFPKIRVLSKTVIRQLH